MCAAHSNGFVLNVFPFFRCPQHCAAVCGIFFNSSLSPVQVLTSKIVTNPRARGRVFGFVVMASAAEANRCISAMHRTTFQTRLITVEKVRRCCLLLFAVVRVGLTFSSCCIWCVFSLYFQQHVLAYYYFYGKVDTLPYLSWSLHTSPFFFNVVALRPRLIQASLYPRDPLPQRHNCRLKVIARRRVVLLYLRQAMAPRHQVAPSLEVHRILLVCCLCLLVWILENL